MNRRQPFLLFTLLAFGYAFLYIPIISLIVYSFNSSRLVTVWGGFSTRWYGELLHNDQILSAAWLSLRIATMNATLSIVLGTLTAITLVRFGRFRGRTLFSTMVSAPLVMPDVILGLASLLLFGVGGVIGLMISGSNVKIPAHYHGSIVGVTLAFMGLVYLLLPRFGFGAVSSRIAVWQLWLYAGGQLLHVAGLVWSGGYGVQRKVAGADQALRSIEAVIAMGVMGLGGLIAVIGGTLFLVLAFAAVLRRPASQRDDSVVDT